MTSKLGILAGRGELPMRLAETCREAGREVFVLAFNGETDPAGIDGFPHAWVDLPAVGRAIEKLKAAGVEELVLIGPVGVPDFKSLKPDWRGAKLLPRIIKAARSGDDAIMKVVVAELEGEGFRVVGAEDVMLDLAAPAGALTRRRPELSDMDDIRRGIEVVRALGRLDIGQAVVVRDGYVLAVEAAEGTDAMLRRCREFARGEPAGVLVKLPKPGQERRADLPTVGLPTVALCAEAGLRGIALEAGGALIVDRQALVEAADAAGIFVFGVVEGEVG